MLWDEKSSGLYELASRTLKSMNGENPDAPTGTQGCRPMPLHCPKSYWKGKQGPKSDVEIDELLRERFGSTYQESREAFAKNEELKQVVEAEKAELKRTAQEARKAVAQMKVAQKPKEKQIATLKKEIASRDTRIAELRAVERVIKSLDGKERARIASEAIQKKIGTFDGVDDFTDTPTGIPDWALDEYRQQSQARLQAEVKAQARRAQTRNRREIEKSKCLICEKMCPKSSMVEKYGDLYCRKCA